ncbi:MAG: hypothetical protein NVSMB27_14580 [Ktedonobacteraceae bacterium]
MRDFLVKAEVAALEPAQDGRLIPLHEGQPCPKCFSLCASMLGEVLPLSPLYHLLHNSARTSRLSLGLFDEGQGYVCLEDGTPISGPFAELDSLLE